jgi:hypothetical protein
MNEIIQLKITLKRIKPPIWRRVLIPNSITFYHLHEIILASMGWDGYHLYEFDFEGERIGVPSDDDNPWWGDDILDAKKEKIKSYIGNTKCKFEYTYDFGDNWEHLIKVEKFLPRDENVKYPICIDGERNCPPEDCGGIGGYYDFIEAINDKNHPEHEEMIEWYGGVYDPEFFDKEEINNRLRRLAMHLKIA